MPVEFVGGLRVSDAATVEVAKMVLVGKVNKDIVLRLNRHGQPAVGLCGDDGLLFRVARQAAPGGEDIGFVGRIERVDVDVLHHIAQDYIPVIASVGADREGNSYNVNADEAAGARRARAGRLQGDVPDRRRAAGCATRPTRTASISRGRRRRGRGGARRRSRAACGPKLAGLRRRDPRRRQRARTSSTAASRTRCCSSCSPTPASARRSAGAHEPGRARSALERRPRDRRRTRAARSSSCAARARGCGTTTATSTSTSSPASRCSNVGHCHPAVVAAIREQAGALIHVGNLFYTEPAMRLARAARRAARSAARSSSRNSGAEADRGGDQARAQGASRAATIVVVARRASTAAPTARCRATPQEAKQAPFAPLVPGFVAVDADAGGARGGGRRAAPRRCSSSRSRARRGVHVRCRRAPARRARGAATRIGAALIFDEIQTGLGRTGHAVGLRAARASCPTR